METTFNVKETVPFFWVTDMEKSLEFYVKGLGFEIQYSWTPDDKIAWCKLKREGASMMLQTHHQMEQGTMKNEGKVGVGVSIYFICKDAIAIYKELIAKGIDASKPFVSNGMWLTSMKDPDGYMLHFDSLTDAPEESEWEG